MRVAFPTQDEQGLASMVYGHFGSAPAFIVVDINGGDWVAVANQNRDHAHGHCQPFAALAGEAVDAIVVGGIGKGALYKLNAGGVRVYRAIEGAVQENVDMFRAGELPEITPAQTCAGHHGAGPCAH